MDGWLRGLTDTQTVDRLKPSCIHRVVYGRVDRLQCRHMDRLIYG